MSIEKDVRIRSRSDSFVNWLQYNPIIMPGEVCYETETQKYKIGTGDINDESTWKHWKELDTNENGKGFKIISVKDNGYTLSSTEGISIGDRVTIRLTHEWCDYSSIKTISGNTIILTDSIPEDTLETDTDKPEKGVIENYLTIIGKPYLGDTYIGYFAHTEGENCIASNRSSHAEGRDTKAIGQFSHAEGRGTIAAYAAHAEGKLSKALGDDSHAEGCNNTAYYYLSVQW